MGAPGSGKTSISKLLAQSLKKQCYDIDNDHLEIEMGWQSVASKLKSVGDELFLEQEANATMLITKDTHSNTIISLSGSNPLHNEAMNHLRQNGIVIYLDVEQSAILRRCDLMKVDRIVGQATKSLDEILKERHNIYEACYDIRIIIGENESLQSIHDKIIHQLNRNKCNSFVSTQDHTENETNTLSKIILDGLSSDDGGLYIPNNFAESLHRFDAGEMQRLLLLNDYADLAQRVLETFTLSKHLQPSDLKQMLVNVYKKELFSDEKSIIPLQKVNKKLYVFELFHGKTASFKDLALALFPSLFLNANGADIDTLFVVATSGDTGSSVLNGFDSQNPNTPIVVLYPKNGISRIQEMQMLKYQNENPNNVLVIGIEGGDFDFCQKCVKSLFCNEFGSEFRSKYKFQLCSANSINWARFLPQIPFYFWAYKQLVDGGQMQSECFDVCVPTGNFGHILGAIVAKRMGVPIRKLIVATNENCILSDFINDEEGIFDNRQRQLHKTNSPSIDILLPSNLERYLDLISSEEERSNENVKKLMNEYKQKKWFQISQSTKTKMDKELFCGKSSDAKCKDIIKRVFQEYKLKIDPHTAIAMDVALSFNENLFDESSNDEVPMVIASTAHYSKFPETMLESLDDRNLSDVEYSKLFDILETEYKSINDIHPEIKSLVNDATLDDCRPEVCSPDFDTVLDKIRIFLTNRK